MNSRSIVLTCIKSLLAFNHGICIFDFLFLTFVSCLFTVTLHIVNVRLTCLINITYLGYLLCHKSALLIALMIAGTCILQFGLDSLN